VKSIYCVFSLCAVCCAPALTQTNSAGMSDQQFVDLAAQTDMMEAHLGQVAAEQAASQNVKEFAQTLVTDHTNDYQQLTAAAGKASLTVPKGLDAAHDKMIAPLAKLKGAAFDRRFAQEMVTGHQKAIAAYQGEAQNGQNADLKAYATQALPTLEKHLQAARELGPSRGKGKSNQ
jgi:putative membrane protein